MMLFVVFFDIALVLMAKIMMGIALLCHGRPHHQHCTTAADDDAPVARQLLAALIHSLQLPFQIDQNYLVGIAVLNDAL